MHHYYKVEAIVLKRINVGEADRIVTVFTRHQGKLRLMAKGVRKITSKRAPHLEVFTRTYLHIAQGRNLDIITEANTIEHFSRLRTELSRALTAFGLAEEIERLCGESQESQRIFQLLLFALKKLNDNIYLDIGQLSMQVSLEILWELGYLPKEVLLQQTEIKSFVESVLERKLKSQFLDVGIV